MNGSLKKTACYKMKTILVFLIRIYKKSISPYLPPSCRFTPTCSEYALEAVNRFGVLKGGWLSIKRVCKCNPFHKGRYDPVPKNRSKISVKVHKVKRQ